MITTGAVITSVIGAGSAGSTVYTGLSGINISGLGVNAIFTVTRTSAVYAVTVTTAGTGYAINDQISIPGTNLDGTSPGNDCVITVATVGVTGNILTVTSLTCTERNVGEILSLNSGINISINCN